ncbi:Zinc transporter ZIP11 [Blattella germanica]|nr:Zinc transporter ZIP11 [Blattella germanica]
MLQNYPPIVQALMGTLFTWGLTAAGAGMVVVFKGTQRKLLDTSLGFAGGVMTAASYWSLLAPAIEMAEESKMYGQNGEYAFAPVALGFLLGAVFVYGTDYFISALGLHSPHLILGFSESLGHSNPLSRRRVAANSSQPESYGVQDASNHHNINQWKRILLLIVAITVHNIPGEFEIN